MPDKVTHWTPEQIKALRKRLGLTRAGFAERLSVGYSTVCLWEQGGAKPDRRNADAIQRLSRETK